MTSRSPTATELDGRGGPVPDAIAEASLAWGRELETQVELARAPNGLAADADRRSPGRAQRVRGARERGLQLHRERRAFARARAAIDRLLDR